jgi:hypothetical protein
MGNAIKKKKKPQAVTLRSIHILVLHDEVADASYLDQDCFADRREAYERGEFSFVGVRAEAEVVIQGVIQTLMNGGLWGIESDSGKNYIQEVAETQWAALRDILLTVGVPASELPAAVNPSWMVYRA